MTTSVQLDRERRLRADDASEQTRIGLLCGLGAYLSWGAVPMYFKLIAHVPAIVVLAHRIVWSVLFLAIVTSIRGSWHEIRSALLTRSHLTALLISTVLISVNWYSFIYSVEHGKLLQASLGYFINPLVSVLLGVGVMKERLRAWQIVGLLLALAGVTILTIYQGGLPWLALIIAFSFGFYGLMRKTMHASAMAGLTVETALLLVPSLCVIAFASRRGLIHASPSISITTTYILLMLSGIITAVPLLMFAAAARRLRLSTMGFLQYISPTSQFLLAVFLFGERFTPVHLASFSLIWAALLIYTSESYLAYRSRGGKSLQPAAEAIDDGAEPTA